MRAGATFLLFLLAAPAFAQSAPTNRQCGPWGFCLESAKPFTFSNLGVSTADFDVFRLKFSTPGEDVGVYAGRHPLFPNCGSACTVEGQAPEKLARMKTVDRRIVGRLIGPIEACGGGAPYLVHVFASGLGSDPMAVKVSRVCP